MSTQEWFSAAQLGALNLPALGDKRTVCVIADRYGWRAAENENITWRLRVGRGGGFEYHLSALPIEARVAIALRRAATEAAAAPSVSRTRERAKRAIERDGVWSWFEGLPETKKSVAAERLRALDAWAALCAQGEQKVIAGDILAAQLGIARSTLYAWETLTLGLDRADWLPALAPRHAGAQRRADCGADAFEMLRSDFLRPERPTFEACWRRLCLVAATRGWTLPSKRTLARRIEAIPESVRTAARDGIDALKAMYPAQQRARGHFHALQAVNADGHRWDVFVRWPDGEIARPMMIAFQDLYSGKVLSWRCDKTENREATRLAFGDLVEEFGIPDRAWLDNGRQFASKWITGGTPNRYRFKLKDDEPLGLLTQLGVEVHWTTPYSGQSKPIERAFRDFAGDVAKHPAFAGAYVGNNPMAKPENYGSAAVPLETFLRVVGEALAEHNARPGRRTEVCRGRSFDAAFAESYATAPIRRATAPQRRLWLLAAESVGCARRDGAITIEGNRFWADFLTALRGSRVSVRFDPAALQDDLHVYALDGRYLGAAQCVEAVGFDDIAAAQAHARARKAWMKAQRAMLDAERRLSPADVAAMLPETAPPVAPERRVVRLAHTNVAVAVRSDELPEQDAAERRLLDGMRKLRLAQTGESDG